MFQENNQVKADSQDVVPNQSKKDEQHGLRRIKSLVVQFVKFGIVGISNTVISLLIYYIFVFINPSLYLIGNIIGWVVSVANAFYWNNRFVFKDSHRGLVAKIARTYLAYAGSALLGTVLLFVLVQLLGISAWLAPIITLVITTPLNFIVNKFWTFKA